MIMYKFSQYRSEKQQQKMGVNGSGVNKGVGGYRPTINWRDITVRKKNVADKQVLSCIVISGIVIIILGVVLTILGFLVISSRCPFEWVSGSGSCYYFAQHNATWESGKEYCQEQGATLLDLHSSNEELFIAGKMVGRSWLGLARNKGDLSFTWVSGSKLNYTQGQISSVMFSSASKRQCGVMESPSNWVVSSCDEEDEDVAFVICEYVPGYNPFVLIGPVVIFCGMVLLLLSIEVCLRRKEFLENNPEVMIHDDDDRQVDSGLVNYGYGNFEGDEDHLPGTTMPITSTAPPPPPPAKMVSWPPVGSSSPTKSQKQVPGSSGIQQVSPVEDTGSGPRVHVVPASLPGSATLAMAPPPQEDNTRSQEQLELLLSPKTLES